MLGGVLGEGKGVAVGVLEPSDFAAGGGGPDAVLVDLIGWEKWVAGEGAGDGGVAGGDEADPGAGGEHKGRDQGTGNRERRTANTR